MMNSEWQSIQQYVTMTGYNRSIFDQMLRSGVSQQQALIALQNIWQRGTPQALKIAQNIRWNPAAITAFTVAVSEVTGTTAIATGGTLITAAVFWELFFALIFCLVVIGIVYWGLKEREQLQRMQKSAHSSQGAGLATANARAVFAAMLNHPSHGPLVHFRNKSLPQGIELPV